jgi:hypothetical protein
MPLNTLMLHKKIVFASIQSPERSVERLVAMS